jgi:peptide chain release factor 1
MSDSSRQERLARRLAEVRYEYDVLVGKLGDPDAGLTSEQLRETSTRTAALESVVAAAVEYQRVIDDRAAALELAQESSGDDREAFRSEAERLASRQGELEVELEVLLLPPDPNANKDVIVEIRGAEGGEEANLWARDLYEMYARYADRMGWKLEMLSGSPSSMGGYGEVSFELHGEGAWAHMKHEAGPHRVQRVPVTESQGRVHTSAATVSVLPEAEEVDIEIDERDLRVDVYRSSSAGGQHVNTTDSAVRITHLPTGVAVAVQDERSQIQNRAKAMTILRSRLLQAEQERQAAELGGLRRSQVGGGGRGEKIRTYNYKENRVTDHRIGLTLYKLDRVLGGELDEVVDALIADERARLLAEAEA